MFESADLDHRIDKEQWAREVPELRSALLAAQYELVKSARFPVILLIGGVDGAGKGETVNLLSEWMDPRHIQTNALRPLPEEPGDRPPMWPFWNALPPKGAIGIFAGSWYTVPLLARVYGDIGGAELTRRIQDIARFERMLTDEGALLLKFWFHLSKKEQKRRLETLAASKKTAWRVTDTDWRHFALYDRFRKISERVVQGTSTGEAPWIIVDGADARYRGLTVGRSILGALKKRLSHASPPAVVRAPPLIAPVDDVHVIGSLDLTKKLASEEDYEDQLAKQQGRLNLLSRHRKFAKISIVVAFEGCDAAGKGGAIRRVTRALDSRHYEVIPIAAPSDEEKARPYLWRFWRRIPARGRMAIFDRSWYGRVLVERVEGFCAEPDWMRAYSEINDFEEQLVKNDTLVVKFWLQVSPDEQLRRFQERERTPWKQFKITPDDWRNREKWDQYVAAVGDMVDRTSTAHAPWTLVEANDKYFARIKILKALADRIEERLE
ncbi:MAG: polyphosphate:AMP phosphotransferase [Myxococcales bacterium]|nr:polyphosphate:AMP phosphotransferase [Myxococcales bacterium]